MVKEYQAPRIFNRIAIWFNRLGVGRLETMTTVGRRSGQPREVPISPIDIAGNEYIVAPYGEVSWVHNVRANPDVTLRNGSRLRRVRLIETTETGAEVVEAYWDKEKFARKYMDVPGEASVEDFATVAGRFPVFRVEEKE